MDHDKLREIVQLIPQQPQRQDSTIDQVRELRVIANRLGMYDAADLLRNICEHAARNGI